MKRKKGDVLVMVAVGLLSFFALASTVYYISKQSNIEDTGPQFDIYAIDIQSYMATIENEMLWQKIYQGCEEGDFSFSTQAENTPIKCGIFNVHNGGVEESKPNPAWLDIHTTLQLTRPDYGLYIFT
jgi:hypothetical protein